MTMFSISKTAKRLIQCAGLVSLAAFAAGTVLILLFFEINLAFFAFGVLWGYAVTCYRVFSLDRNLNNSVDLTAGKAKGYAILGFFFRYLLTFGALAAAVFVPFLDIWGAFIGVLSLQPAGYLVRLFIKDEDVTS
jgi:hypothetical protein